jgi:Zn2+/Cd2+-exporting ATPase
MSDKSCCGNEPVHNHDHDHDHGNEFNIRQESIVIAIVVSLLALGAIFEERLHQSIYAPVEYLIFIPAYLLSGWTVLTSAGKNILRGQIFDENFLMSIATLGAIAIHQLPEAVGVMLFFQVGELFQGYAVGKGSIPLFILPRQINIMY